MGQMSMDSLPGCLDADLVDLSMEQAGQASSVLMIKSVRIMFVALIMN